MVEVAGVMITFMIKKKMNMSKYALSFLLGLECALFFIVGKHCTATQESKPAQNTSAPSKFLKVFVDEKDENERFLLKNPYKPLIEHKKNIKKTDKNVLFHKALTDAYGYSPQIQSKLREYYKVAENISSAMAGFRPSITAKAETGYEVKEEQNSAGYDIKEKPDKTIEKKPWPVKHAQSKNPHALTLNIVQNLYKGGETLANISAAQHQILSARADVLNTEQSVLISAIKAYMDLWLKQEKLKIAQSSENFYKKSLEQTKAQALVGESAATMDVALAESEYEKSVAQRMASEKKMEIAQGIYVHVTGVNPPSVLTLPESIRQSVQWPSSLSSLLAHVEKYHPEILKAHYACESAKDQIDVASSSLLPKVDLEGSKGRSISTGARHDRQNESSVKLRMTVPIYDKGGADWSSVRQSMQTAEQKKHEIMVTKDQSLQDARQIWTNIQASKTKIAHYKKAIQASKKCVAGSQQEYLAGERSLLEVLKAEQETDKLQDSLLEAIHDEIVNEYLLLSVLGELTPQFLNLDIKSYDLNTYPEKAQGQLIGKI